MAAAFAGDAALGFGLRGCCEHCRRQFEERLSGDERCERQGRGDGAGLREAGAACADRRGSAVLRHPHGAVMRAVAAAAERQVCFCVLCEQRRHGWEAEGCEQQDGEKATHLF